MEAGHSSYRTLLCWYLSVCPYSLWSCLSVSSHPGVLLKHSSFLHCSKVCDYPCTSTTLYLTSKSSDCKVNHRAGIHFYSHLLPISWLKTMVTPSHLQITKVWSLLYYGWLNLVRAFEMKVGWPIGVRFFILPTLIHLIDWWLFGTVCLLAV